MTDDTDAILDDLLSRWHAWSQADGVGSGYNRRALVVGDFRISRQHDDANGALDAELDKRQVHAVEFAVRSTDDPWRTALYCEGRRCYTGAAVWTHPRIAREDRARVTAEARGMLVRRLRSAGVV